jgi:ATP-dependent helicase/nuclease subunit A
VNRPLHLQGDQRRAVEPRECVWLAASAGTGKTQVLASRVLRLLLRPDTEPSQILCLTFTKAGATEMAVRVSETLARWVRLPNRALAEELTAIGAPIDPATRERARTLFARVLDTPGGGLRIETIHAFAQYLLASFPEEAGLAPGATPMEDRERDLLSRRVLERLHRELVAGGRHDLLNAMSALSLRHGPAAVLPWLMRCAEAIELWLGPAQWTPPFADRLGRLLDMPAGADEAWAAAACSDEVFPRDALEACLKSLRNWDAATGREAVAFGEAWLAFDASARLDAIDSFFGTFLVKKDGAPKKMGSLAKADLSLPGNLQLVADAVAAVVARRQLLRLRDIAVPALELGRTFALRWDEAKRREGLVDFDDQIAMAARLLRDSAASDWIRYKLDRQFEHVLIDEAQDTNADQWRIIQALIDDFFDGLAAHDGRARTIFTVGDTKQAIFGFQGTSPRNFLSARDVVDRRMDAAAENAAEFGAPVSARRLQHCGLVESFRTAAPVLDFVDELVRSIGPGQFGLEGDYADHVGEDRPGQVVLWNLVTAEQDDEADPAEPEDADADRAGWIASHEWAVADRIADQIACWMKDGYPLVKGTARLAKPGDVMVLVRKRRELAGLIVARLYARGVPVAGVDRLRIGNPLAVKDLLAAVRFAAQPLDDLTLANLLVSPLCGWSQDELLEHGYRPPGRNLWDHLKVARHPRVMATVEHLRELLSRADFEPPLALLTWLLTGPFEGRRKLVARLGSEVGDPIEELLNAAAAFAASQTVSLQGFIRWFDAGTGEVKREAEGQGDTVRVLTVHGAKGLQAPLVILADAAIPPDTSKDLSLAETPLGGGERRQVPIPGFRKDEIVGRLADARDEAKAAAMEEHWRLLYVAMTRAEEGLFIAGSLPRSAKGGAHPDSWHARAESLFEKDEALDDPVWGARWERGSLPPRPARAGEPPVQKKVAIPDWALEPVGAEPSPPRPLAPSSLGQEDEGEPPARSDAAVAAARRGSLIHGLLERLPQTEPPLRERAGSAWLARHAADLPEAERDDMLASVLALMSDKRFAEFFGHGSLAEVPFSAVVGGKVVQGCIDRLVLSEGRVSAVDFKTTRQPPAGIAEVPAATLRQMAAYHAALKAIYPDRRVEIALLYTRTPLLVPVPEEMLDEHMPAAR